MESDLQQQEPPQYSTATSTAVIGLHYDIPTTVTTPSSITNGDHSTTTVTELLQAARLDGFRYITCRIPEHTSMNMNASDSTSSSSSDDYQSLVTLESSDWRTSIVGIMTLPNLTVTTSATTTTAATPSMTLMTIMTKIKDRLVSSIEWCLHMNIAAIIIPSFDAIDSAIRMAIHPSQVSTDVEIHSIIRQYANSLLSCLIQTNVRDLQIWIPHIMSTDIHSMTSSSSCSHDRPMTLQYFYQLVDYHPSIRTLYTFPHLDTKNTIQTQQVTLLQHCIQQIHIDIGSLPPIGAIQIPTTLFTKNKRGYPTLKRMHQHCFIQLYRRLGPNMKVLLTRTSSHYEHAQSYSNLSTSQLGRSQLLPHCQYIQHLRVSKTEISSALDGIIVNNNNDPSDSTSKVSAIRTMELEYNDVLQSPLQPLADHLENYTYHIFEQDPIKYVQYENAIYHTMFEYFTQSLAPSTALPTAITMDTSTVISSLGSNTTRDTGNPPARASVITYIALVVGAGRGPLVTCTMKAFDKIRNTINAGTVQLQLYIYAVEKNPNAILYLRSKFRQWINPNGVSNKDPNVHLQIIHSDLRYLNADTLFQNIVQQQQSQSATFTNTQTTTVSPQPQQSASSYKANLIVSELLGSFGCNELSPECLDTLLHQTNVCSKPITKSIPYHYTSHVAPISSMKLYHNVKQQALYPTCVHSTQQQMIGLLKAFETPYVVRPNMVSQIYATQDCWSFTHTPFHSSDASIAATSSMSDILTAQERYVHLEFGSNESSDKTLSKNGTEKTTPQLPFIYGAQYGAGYGPLDEYVQSTMIVNQDSRQTMQQSACAAWTCTGMLGTFTADLYYNNNPSTQSNNATKDIQISTNPDTFSTGMFSWFPLYFPCIQPIHVPKFGNVHVDIWRKCSSNKVWYEWMFTVVEKVAELPTTTTNSNNGRTTTTASHDNDNSNKDNTNNMETDHDDVATDLNKTTIIGHDEPTNTTTTTTILYISPIHNPGGRSSYVSLLS